MNIVYNAIALTILIGPLSLWGAPTLLPYDANNRQIKNAVIALYRNKKGASADIPLALDENYTFNNTTQPFRASIFVDDNNKVIGLIIHKQITLSGKLVSFIQDFIMDKNHSGQASAFMTAFEKEKRRENYVQINAEPGKDDVKLFQTLGFREMQGSGIMGKKLSQ